MLIAMTVVLGDMIDIKIASTPNRLQSEVNTRFCVNWH